MQLLVLHLPTRTTAGGGGEVGVAAVAAVVAVVLFVAVVEEDGDEARALHPHVVFTGLSQSGKVLRAQKSPSRISRRLQKDL